MTEQKWLTSDDPQVMLNELEFRRQWFNTKGGQDRCISDRKLRLFACACARSFYPRLLADPKEVDFLPSIERAEKAADAGVSPPLSGEWIVSERDASFAARMAIEDLLRDGWEHCLPKAAALLREVAGNPFRPVTLPKGSKCHLCGGIGYIERPVICGPDTSEAEMRRLADEAGGDIPCASCRATGYQPCSWLTPTVLSLAHAAYDERPGRKCPNCRFNEAWADGGWFRCGKCKDGHIDDGTLDPHRLAVLADALEEAGCPAEQCEDCGSTRTRCEHTICVECGGWIEPHHILSHLRSPGPHVRGCWALDLLLGLA